MPTRRALAASALLLCGCESVVDGSRDKFSSEFTCPVDRVEAHPRPELHPSTLEGSSPPGDVAADPERLKMWRDRQAMFNERRDSNDDIIEVSGCGKHVLYACHRYSKGFNRFMCRTEPLPPALQEPEPVLTLATLANAPLKSSPATKMTPPQIVGSYDAFDVVGNYDWASSIATTWSPDATLYRVSAGHVPFDGKVDLVTPAAASLGFYFYSHAKGDVDLTVDVSPYYRRKGAGGFVANVPADATVDLSVASHYGDAAAIAKPTCTLDLAIAALRGIGALANATEKAGTGVELRNIAGKPYWQLIYSDAAGKRVDVDVNASKCAIEHPH